MKADTKPRVLVSAPLAPELTDALRTAAAVVSRDPAVPLTGETAGPYADCTGWIITARQPVEAGLLDALPALRVLSTVAAGYDNIDVDAASARGVKVCHTPGVLDAAVAELAIGMIIAGARGLVTGDVFVRSGSWTDGRPPLADNVHGSTLGILGMGRIGQRVAHVAHALGMRVAYHNRTPVPHPAWARWTPRDDLFRQADHLLITAALTDESRGSVGAREFALMKPGSRLVNVARGAIVDEPALLAALREQRIAGAALDVMESEPVGADHPLCRLPNTILLPHIGSSTHGTRAAMSRLAVDNVRAVLSGTYPATCLNPPATVRGSSSPAAGARH